MPRFYENRYPEVDSLVMVQVKSIEELGAYVKLVSMFIHAYSTADHYSSSLIISKG
jgi:translation initiation factor 2 alpha subunit (eIF-2alpha)